MKKLIAISVVFALIAGTAFAVDLGGAVIGTVNAIQGDTSEGSTVEASGGLNRVRLEGSGEAGDGDFGGWIRAEAGGFAGLAWWKPIDQFKLTIGGNPDGFFGKEGVTGWMFYQTAYDTGVVVPGNVWGWGHVLNDDWDNGGNYNVYGQGLKTRNAFFGGFGGNGALITIAPAEVVDINIVVPFMNGGEAKEVFMSSIAQLDFKLDFGNIALTYAGDKGFKEGKAGKTTTTYKQVEGYYSDANGTPITSLYEKEEKTDGKVDGYDNPGTVFAYFNLSSIENLGMDVGVGFKLPNESTNNPLAAGLGLKYATDSFGVKLRAVAQIPLEDFDSMAILADILPFFNISDSLRAFVSVGLGMTMPPSAAPSGAESILGWHFNPYLEVGSEWGAKFLAGIQVFSDGIDTGDGAAINFAVPIAMMVSF